MNYCEYIVKGAGAVVDAIGGPDGSLNAAWKLIVECDQPAMNKTPWGAWMCDEHYDAAMVEHREAERLSPAQKRTESDE